MVAIQSRWGSVCEEERLSFIFLGVGWLMSFVSALLGVDVPSFILFSA